MFPFKNSIILERSSSRNLYLQLCDQIITLIKSGKLSPSTKLPGSRKLASELQVHRKTVISAYDELTAQGWIMTIPAKGTFVHNELPIVTPHNLNGLEYQKTRKNTANFSFTIKSNLGRTSALEMNNSKTLSIGDGAPDHRLAPIEEIARIYRNLTKKEHHKNLLSYSSIYGNTALRKALVTYLNETRGLDITIDNIMITRGSQMGVYLSSQLLLNNQKIIVVGSTNYMTADETFEDSGGIIERVAVDTQGINTNELEVLCKQKEIQAVYVTSHHHHPTTVTLSAERRMHLLQLAQKHKFAVIEDDYDYDFHYSNAPILPLASNDYYGNVIYIGAFSKIIAPAMRIGYLIGPKNFVDEAANLRRIIDRQGDTILEETLAKMIQSGDVQRHSAKVLKIYKVRRDLFCSLLKEKLGDYFEFEIPKGGMAVWVILHKKYHWNLIASEAKKHNLTLSDWRRYDNANSRHNGIRMGFASLNEEEIHLVIDKLSEIMHSLYS